MIENVNEVLHSEQADLSEQDHSKRGHRNDRKVVSNYEQGTPNEYIITIEKYFRTKRRVFQRRSERKKIPERDESAKRGFKRDGFSHI
jgi:hypothetical protein